MSSRPISPAQQLRQLWRQGQRPDVRTFLAGVGGVTLAELGEVLEVDQEERWNIDERVPARSYLNDFPQLRDDPEAALGVVYGEYLLREGDGERLDPGAFERDYPECAPLLARQLALHEVFDEALEARGNHRPTLNRTAPAAPPGYTIRGFLGGGSFGEVWLAHDENLDRLVALKTLYPRLPSVDRDKAVRALRQDAHILAGLRHPNVVQVYAWLGHGEVPHLALQYVAGGSLSCRLERQGPLDWRDAARYMADAGEGLLEVHARGILHRDIKPANLLWDSDRDEALMTDFGVSSHLAEAHGVAGTPLYMAPEVFEGLSTPAADVYSLAATLFHLTTGEPPFRGPSLQDLRRQIATGLAVPDARFSVLPEALERVIRDGLAVRQEDRPVPRAFVAALRGALNLHLADALAPTSAAAKAGAPVNLRLTVSCLDGGGTYRPVMATHLPPERATRDIRKVPPQPDRVRMRTGDRMRIEVEADRDGYITVFNVGPTGSLNLLHPPDASTAVVPPVGARHPITAEAELTPPVGHERLFAVWSRWPLPLEKLRSLADRGEVPGSRPYRATRDMKCVQGAVDRLRPDDWHAAILELEHQPLS